MSLGDISIISPGGQHFPPSLRCRMEANTTVANPGEPLAVGGTGTNYVAVLADAKPITSDASFAGVAATLSNQTASADGVVDVLLPVAGVVYACKAQTASTFDTDAEILAVLFDNVYLNLAAGVYTVDIANASAGGTGAFRIVGGDPTTATVYFVTKSAGTFLA
jgi:hypothetical protein